MPPKSPQEVREKSHMNSLANINKICQTGCTILTQVR